MDGRGVKRGGGLVFSQGVKGWVIGENMGNRRCEDGERLKIYVAAFFVYVLFPDVLAQVLIVPRSSGSYLPRNCMVLCVVRAYRDE